MYPNLHITTSFRLAIELNSQASYVKMNEKPFFLFDSNYNFWWNISWKYAVIIFYLLKISDIHDYFWPFQVFNIISFNPCGRGIHIENRKTPVLEDKPRLSVQIPGKFLLPYSSTYILKSKDVYWFMFSVFSHDSNKRFWQIIS